MHWLPKGLFLCHQFKIILKNFLKEELKGEPVGAKFATTAADGKNYQVETAHLKRQVRRNIERFEGEEFMFQLTSEEWKNFTNSCLQASQNNNNSDSFSDNYDLRSQFVTSRLFDKWAPHNGGLALV